MPSTSTTKNFGLQGKKADMVIMDDFANTPLADADAMLDAAEQAGMSEYLQILRDKILHGLAIYPALSPSMLHVFLGTATSVQVWKPILETLIREGLVSRQEVSLRSSYGRAQTYSVLHLTANAYTPPEDQVQPPTDTATTNA